MKAFIFLILSGILFADYVKIETFLTDGSYKKFSRVISINDKDVSSSNLLVLHSDVSKLFESCFFEEESSSLLCNIVIKDINEKVN